MARDWLKSLTHWSQSHRSITRRAGTLNCNSAQLKPLTMGISAISGYLVSSVLKTNEPHFKNTVSHVVSD